MQSEASALLKRLNETAKKVSNSEDELKEQYAKILEVRREYLLCQQMGPIFEKSVHVFVNNSSIFSAAGKTGGMSSVERKVHCNG